ncbi:MULTISPECIES: pyrophosphate--fructose-6-phosphate 1-phosphotransferase [Cellulomonas]|jgi:pyrophosphate--fructose-6-phosphate 1-phosphotransferase|uniref:Pyrophosphate--fructose 6-phosphate 1-phosphotransferase n=1 Tax=Cellulomonas iranensis TaxID=76862 RepID=A0ABU0GN53_9CELL|nr:MULTISPECIES: pyrophosphate--fructose-6-phosphate 1-phosphotransferase [Cellulomonas]MBO9567393.1 pyrophosphate--fructose-6-phosphate 1-phosphotransferase [Cellulomonas iranensis]MDQ0426791.1 pyrophosphate--fructose-6-phosphate 1-phosphotransferase [Cellulomonas iranensis]TFH74406.1 pyrophosphate--fructose-6-phosphate 1-phosphotransferase [Cellulomonas sp. HD19AZ1]UCN16163.1 pyrophosphate--fructose-6-phosphate 1-phosphotransferase [Cellulomonas iranensis]
MSVRRVALLTAGGFAPCLSSAVGGLIERYTEIAPDVEIIAYQHGYHGLLLGESVTITPEVRAKAGVLHRFGGSPIGNSRVKLTNAADCVKRGLVAEGEDPLKVAAERLKADGVDVLHTIGGDDTNTTAADLAAYLHENDYELTVVGLPKTIDNDVVPIRQSLGAWTAAEEAAGFAANIIGEHRSGPRMLIVHEVMGRHCGWLTAAAASEYRKWLDQQEWVPGIGLSRERWDVHAVFLPELALDIDAEAARLRTIMDEQGNVNIFLSEGAGMHEIVEQLEAAGETVQRDPFGHVKLDTINPGQWFAKQFAEKLGAEKVMVQKSGYYSRAAAANAEDLRLIKSMTDLAVECALRGESGVIGHDEENGDRLRAIEFPRIAGGKAFDVTQGWFGELLADIGQPLVRANH